MTAELGREREAVSPLAGRLHPGHAEPKEHEFNQPTPPRVQNLQHAMSGTTLDQGHHRLQDGTDGEPGLRSRRWREACSRLLPKDFRCTPTRKTFHFANGQSAPDKLVVWRIPIFVSSVPGEVHSAEVCGLDMILHMKSRKVLVQDLGLEIPMLVTRTKHLAIRVALALEPGQEEKCSADRPEAGARVTSEAEEILVYFLEKPQVPLPHALSEEAMSTTSEAPDLRARGVKGSDERGTVSERRVNELQRAAAKQKVLDKRAQGALRRGRR